MWEGAGWRSGGWSGVVGDCRSDLLGISRSAMIEMNLILHTQEIPHRMVLELEAKTSAIREVTRIPCSSQYLGVAVL
jgi:hypothetical protein